MQAEQVRIDARYLKSLRNLKKEHYMVLINYVINSNKGSLRDMSRTLSQILYKIIISYPFLIDDSVHASYLPSLMLQIEKKLINEDKSPSRIPYLQKILTIFKQKSSFNDQIIYTSKSMAISQKIQYKKLPLSDIIQHQGFSQKLAKNQLMLLNPSCSTCIERFYVNQWFDLNSYLSNHIFLFSSGSVPQNLIDWVCAIANSSGTIFIGINSQTKIVQGILHSQTSFQEFKNKIHASLNNSNETVLIEPIPVFDRQEFQLDQPKFTGFIVIRISTSVSQNLHFIFNQKKGLYNRVRIFVVDKNQSIIELKELKIYEYFLQKHKEKVKNLHSGIQCQKPQKFTFMSEEKRAEIAETTEIQAIQQISFKFKNRSIVKTSINYKNRTKFLLQQLDSHKIKYDVTKPFEQIQDSLHFEYLVLSHYVSFEEIKKFKDGLDPTSKKKIKLFGVLENIAFQGQSLHKNVVHKFDFQFREKFGKNPNYKFTKELDNILHNIQYKLDNDTQAIYALLFFEREQVRPIMKGKN